MSEPIVEAINPFQKTEVAEKSVIRNFVRELFEISEKLKDAKSDLKEAINSMEEVQSIDQQIKDLKAERVEFIKGSSVLQGYEDVVRELMEEKQAIIDQAKQDNVPKKEIDLAIKMLRTDVSPQVTTEVYADIADLV